MKGFPLSLINIPITSHICLFLVRTFEFYSLKKYQLYNTVINCNPHVYIKSLDLIHLIAEHVYLSLSLPYFSHSTSPWQPLLPSLFHAFFFFFLRFHILKIPCCICLYFTLHNAFKAHVTANGMISFLFRPE